MKVIINPITKRYDTMRRTVASVGQSEGDIIRTSTVVKSQAHSLLLSNTAPQLENSEPLPEFSRDPLHGSARFDAAKQAAQRAAEQPEKTSSETTAD